MSYFFCCSKTNQKLNCNINVLSDFYFKIDDGGNDSYNSKTGSFKRNYLDGAKVYEITLNEDEMKSIYELFKAISFQNFPSKFVIIPNEKDVTTSISPSFET